MTSSDILWYDGHVMPLHPGLEENFAKFAK